MKYINYALYHQKVKEFFKKIYDEHSSIDSAK